jgi:transcriptional repressor NrdR
MRCPVCAHDETQIVATRESDESDVIRRGLKCEKRFTTDELSKIALPAVEGLRLAGVLPCHHRHLR